MEKNLSADAQQEETKEGEEEVTTEDTLPEVTEEDTSSDDPLDSIEDLEVLRQKAKEYKTSYHKVKEQRDALKTAKPEIKEKPSETPYMTKKDFEVANEKKAIKLAWADEEIKANWDNIKNLYVNRSGRDTEADILEDIKDAYTLWKAKQPLEKETPEKDLTETTVKKPSGQTSKETSQKGFKVLSPDGSDLAEVWYGKSK